MTGPLPLRAVLASAGLALGATGAMAGPDVIVSTIGATLTKYGTNSGVTGYSMTTVSCNIGDAIAIWIDSTSTAVPNRNQHPVIGQQLYRLHNGRMEQIGMSWLKHGFCAADAPSCVNLVPGSTYQPNASCDWLGLFATDTYSASLNGQQSNLGPRSEVNPSTGVFPYPYIRAWNQSGNCTFKRLQVANSDLSPQNYPGARYFGEVHYITTDEAADKRSNNASYREIVVGSLSATTSGCTQDAGASGYNLAFSGATIPMKSAIEAWKTIDPTVTLVSIDIPGDGRVILGYKVTDRGDGTWSYEYAVYNHNSERGIGSFALPKSANNVAAVYDVGFHDVAYHSGEPYSGTDWSYSVNDDRIRWSTEAYAADANANAIRWSCLYNFRFVSNRRPSKGMATLGLFKPGLAGDPSEIGVPGVDVPTDHCVADFNSSGSLTIQDLLDFVTAFLAGDPSADLNNIEGVTVQDLFDYLGTYFAGC